jgi:FkbM family methyltransferase
MQQCNYRILATMSLLLSNASYSNSTRPEVSFLKQFISPNDLVFDVGANIGKKTDLYLEVGAHVICIEPQANCCEILQRKYSSSSRVHIVSKGLSYYNGTVSFSVCSQANTISTCSTEWQTNSRFTGDYVWDKQITIPVTTLDDLIEQFGKPVFCKIDVENYEFEVLKGLSQPIRFLSFEFAHETAHNTQRCLDRLTELGYTQFNFALGENPAFILNDWTTAAELIDILQTRGSLDKLLWGDIYAYHSEA